VPFCLAFLTDIDRVPNQKHIISALPDGAAVIFRDYRSAHRYQLAKAYRQICKNNNLLFLVAGDSNLAKEVNADGLHLPSRDLHTYKPLTETHLLTCACHSAKELQYAAELGAHLAFLSPVFTTRSHPDTNELGPTQFKKLAKQTNLPILALGGVTELNADMLAGENVFGFGAIGAFNAKTTV